ncbi:MAG: cell wall-binding repeat-containing protein, partial [Paenisporosarcina sp.]
AYVASSYLMPEKKVSVLNLSGKRRYETSARISNVGWHSDLAQTVVLGRGDLPIDALTGSVLAAQKGAPILLTESTNLTAPIAKELSRLKPEIIYILGGESAISTEVEKTLRGIYPKVIRLNGVSRYDTARVVGNEVASAQSISEIFIASGSETSPDALAIAPVAGMKKVPILLQSGVKLRKETKLFIQEHNITKVTLIGGEGVLPPDLNSQLKDAGVKTIDRVAGKDRYLTATAVASKYFSNPNGVFFARGDQIVDALSGSSLASKWKQPILLTKSTSVPKNVQVYLKEVNPAPNVNYLGGISAINEPTRTHIETLVWQ